MDLAEHHQVRLAQAVDGDKIAAALAGERSRGQVVRRRGQPLVGAEAEPDGAREDRHADDLVGDGIGVDVGDVRDLLGRDLASDDAEVGCLPLLVGVGMQHVVDGIGLGACLQLRQEREGLIRLHAALELLLEGGEHLALHEVAPLAAPGRDLERGGLRAQHRRRGDHGSGSGAGEQHLAPVGQGIAHASLHRTTAP